MCDRQDNEFANKQIAVMQNTLIICKNDVDILELLLLLLLLLLWLLIHGPSSLIFLY